MATDDLRKKLVTLHAKLQELSEQQSAILSEIDHLLGGGAGVGAILKRLQDHYSRTWEVRYRTPYAFLFKKDMPLLKALLARLSVEDIELRMVSYIKNPDPFFVSKQHPFGLFVSTINQHAGAALGQNALFSVPGCTHEPRCPSDQAHTMRRAEDMRAGHPGTGTGSHAF